MSTEKLSPTDYQSIGSAGASKTNAQWWLLLAILVANKPAEISERKTHQFLGFGDEKWSPFEKLHWLIESDLLRKRLEDVKTGQYTRIEKAFRGIAKTWLIYGDDPRTWSIGALISISGIGPKTARWFYLLVQPNADVAALDTHVLKHLKHNGVTKVPKSTPPPGPEYDRLERAFVAQARSLGMKPSQLDYFVWAVYRNGGTVNLRI